MTLKVIMTIITSSLHIYNVTIGIQLGAKNEHSENKGTCRHADCTQIVLISN